jgi:ABC-type glutathione transport system ATPase component
MLAQGGRIEAVIDTECPECSYEETRTILLNPEPASESAEELAQQILLAITDFTDETRVAIAAIIAAHDAETLRKAAKRVRIKLRALIGDSDTREILDAVEYEIMDEGKA